MLVVPSKGNITFVSEVIKKDGNADSMKRVTIFTFAAKKLGTEKLCIKLVNDKNPKDILKEKQYEVFVKK